MFQLPATVSSQSFNSNFRHFSHKQQSHLKNRSSSQNILLPKKHVPYPNVSISLDCGGHGERCHNNNSQYDHFYIDRKEDQ